MCVSDNSVADSDCAVSDSGVADDVLVVARTRSDSDGSHESGSSSWSEAGDDVIGS